PTLKALKLPRSASYRLPDSMIPLYYQVTLQPRMYNTDPDKFVFKGSVKIHMRCHSPTNNITLHASGLILKRTSVKFFPEERSFLGDPKYTHFVKDKERQFVTFWLDKTTEHYWLQMDFKGPLRTEPVGLYYSEYMDNNVTKYMVNTQLQPIYARKVFPCFDEPATKAQFQINILRPANRISLSNMPIDNSDEHIENNGIVFQKDVYARTPTMSTYLLAFAVCDFHSQTRIFNDSITLKTWAQPRFANDTLTALHFAEDLLGDFKDFFAVKISFIKARKHHLLYNSAVNTKSTYDRMASTISRQFAHQWFAARVAPTWWTDDWVNEAVASFLARIRITKLVSPCKTDEIFVAETLHPVMELDSTDDTRPLSMQVQTPAEITNLFDDIYFKKGVSIVRMAN
ncbi:unnamed protein product, partial [Candidula unifasciata]